MMLFDDKLLSDDIFETSFACNLQKCKGNCCVKGDAGAPLLQTEVEEINKNLDQIIPFMDELGKNLLKKDGFFLKTAEELETTCAPSGECVFVAYKNNIATCGLENAYQAGKSSFQKPISCHLYPIRISKVGEYTALNYHKWDICAPACENGKKAGIPLFQFLKTSIIRAFGTTFYETIAAYYQLQKENLNHKNK